MDDVSKWVEAQALSSNDARVEKTRRIHDDRLRKDKQFQVGEQVLLFNSRLKLFPEKLKYRWSGPYLIMQTFPHGAVEISQPTKGTFSVNGHRLKHYTIREDIPSLTMDSVFLLHDSPA
ncbi:uncharacterized protein LOC120255738 [Dioscorea cayenensis subsp. rotundata]|uniref:Uncharacterized protein LOC120255738 n=1 Tax=Dioscorea cayennensis subsp. rotundata TaxID=55577 RepID=A0AB40AY16_DIOCR|nr:uncharacterized protein LOC120255738 [Dioscorea cayenensis subsp. rotundata]